MLDEDIQYMGSRPSLRMLPAHSFLSPQRPVTGITLHVEKSGTDSSYGLIYRRANTSVVHVGRRPATDPEQSPQDSECGRAMFRCAVVSRKHAKIAFSDAGHAYLIDLGSHHGTHIRKPSEIASRMLKPETPALLADGDVITFGKSVGKNNEFVRPVVVRVELLYGSPSATDIFKPLFVPSGPSTPVGHSNHSSLSSGRYGIHDSSSSSSDSSSSPASDRDSDVEEVSPPLPLPTSNFKSISSVDGESANPLGRAFEVLKRLLPPVHVPYIPHREHSPLVDLASLPPLPSLPSIAFSDFRAFSPEYHPSCVSPPYHRSPSPIFPGSPMINSYEIEEAYPTGLDSSARDVFDEPESNGENRSRSTSPMDLASPSPAPVEIDHDFMPPQPLVVGAWPTSRSSSPNIVSTPPQLVSPSPPAEPTTESTSEQAADSKLQNSPENHMQAEETVAESSELPPAEPCLSAPESADIAELKLTVGRLQTEVTKLQAHRRKYKSRFNANVNTIANKLTRLDDRLADVDRQYGELTDQVESCIQFDIPDLQAQMENLQSQFDALPSTSDRSSEVHLSESEERRMNAQTVQQWLDSMATLRETTEQAMRAELEAVKAAREAAIASMMAAPIQTPVLPSLKRKRSDEDEDEEAQNEDVMDSTRMSVDVGVGADVDHSSAAAVNVTTGSNSSGIDMPSPPKRARRIASVVVQTATAVTLGAVATWSALAFS